jgi:DtxR family transcriptional regulator, Mn-dependent transcriptional regulator
MVAPLTALTAFAALCVIAGVIFWPRRGLVARVHRRSGWGERVQLEDALKHLHLRERQARSGSLEDLAGRLEVSTGRAAQILSQLVSAGLARSEESGPSLTDEGRSLARQTIRTHRLWERWLADRTGVRAEEWHEQAERMEHALSPEETEVLASRLGHPRYDPHGDPIPTAGGDLPPLPGIALTEVPAGRAVRVVHLEDEPPEIFLHLLERGLAVGVEAAVVARSDHGGIMIRTPDGEQALDSVAAGHVSVELLPEGTQVATSRRSLDDVAIGETVQVTGLSPACQGPQRRRLLDLGFVRGGRVMPELVSASNDPVAYRILGALIALRREQARWVSVADVETEAEEAAPPLSGVEAS